VIIGVRPDGTKEWVAIGDRLRDLKARGLQAGPCLAVGDGAPGLWGAPDQVYPETVHRRCWFHTLGNVLNALPKSLHGKAKADLQAIRMAPTRQQATHAFTRFINRDGAQYPKATEKREKDRAAMLAFVAFPADPRRVHLRTTNPIESTFATVRHRTGRTKNGVTRATFLGLAFKMSEEAAKTWRRIRAPEKVAELLGGARYDDGSPVPDDPPETQEEQRAAA
jgi:transposase-like protein